MDVIRNLICRRPELVFALIDGGADAALATLTTEQLPRHKKISRALEDYQKDAAKRAEELSKYIKQWPGWTSEELPELERVSIAHALFVEQ